jgi:hypothetical protein
MLLEYNERSVLWGAIIGFILSLIFSISVYNDPEIPFGNYTIILPTLFSIAIYHIIISNFKTNKLIEILNGNKTHISESEVYFEGEKIYPDTNIIQFRIIMSMIFVCFTIHTRPHLFRGKRPWINGLGYSALSLVLGLWSRKGIAVTPAAILQNLRYTEQNTVQEICLRMEAWGKPVKIN